MNRKTAMQQDGKVFEIHDIRCEVLSLDPDYILDLPQQASLGGTGLLTVFKLRHRLCDGPSFEARWDGGSRETGKTQRYDLDIQIKGVSKSIERKFVLVEGRVIQDITRFLSRLPLAAHIT